MRGKQQELEGTEIPGPRRLRELTLPARCCWFFLYRSGSSQWPTALPSSAD